MTTLLLNLVLAEDGPFDDLKVWAIVIIAIVSALGGLLNKKKQQQEREKADQAPRTPGRPSVPAPRRIETSSLTSPPRVHPVARPAMRPSPAPIGIPEFLLRSPPATERAWPVAADLPVGRSTPPAVATTTTRDPRLHRPTRAALDALLRDRVGLRAGFVLSEVLGPPLALREPHEGSWL